MKTVLEVITVTTDYFAKNKVESPRLNIEHLLAHVLGKRRMDLYLEFDRPLSEKELSPLRDLVRRRADGEPLQHLLGTVEFLEHTLICDRRALIPRQETEQLCEILMEESKAEGCAWKSGHIADIGTGSGCIALSLAAAFPEARVTAVDASPDALSLARANMEKIGLSARVTLFEGDLLAPVEAPVDLLVANLPYIPSEEIAGLSREVRHDPLSALDGGEDGLVLVRRMLAQCQGKLASGARIALELADGQPSKLAGEIDAKAFGDISVRKDYSGRERYFFGSMK